MLATPPRRDAWSARVVWSAWAALSVAAIALVVALGADVPFGDEWGDIVPLYAGVRPLDAGTLWSPHNEHRLPLARLLLIGLGRATEHDFRAGMLFNALALSASSALLLQSARGVDGRLRLADCALPLLLLHWGHYMTLLWAYQVHVALLVLVSSALLAALARRAEPPSLGATVAFGAGLLMLPLCQAAGVALAPALATWLAAAGVLRSGATGLRRAGAVALAFSAAAIAVAALAYLQPRAATAHAPPRVLWGSAVMLSTAFGVTERGAPLTWLLPAALASMVIATAALLLRVVRMRPRERLRAAGFGLFALAFLAVALGIAWGRPGESLSSRYPALAAPFACVVYLTWRRYGTGRAGPGVCTAMCLALALLLPWNAAAGLRFARAQAATAVELERDVRAGMPLAKLAARYEGRLHPTRRTLRRGLECLRAAGIGVFRRSGAS